jgi:hypothetical protein
LKIIPRKSFVGQLFAGPPAAGVEVAELVEPLEPESLLDDALESDFVSDFESDLLSDLASAFFSEAIESEPDPPELDSLELDPPLFE